MLTNRHRTAQPRYNSASRRPQYDASLWEGRNYAPLQTGDLPREKVNNNDMNGPVSNGYTEGGSLRAVDLDLNQYENRKPHHTMDYETQQLVVRRGQPFTITVFLDQPFTQGSDQVKLQFATGKRPLESKNTLERLTHSDRLSPGDWGMTIEGVQETKVQVKVIASAEAVVGEYQVLVDTIRGTGTEAERHRYSHPDKIVILFNPWCKEDQVFMEREDHRGEYVMNDTGRVYQGGDNKIISRPWNFGQFDQVCLEAALYLLDISDLTKQGHGNPTKVVRKLTAMANINDNDMGVLQGNWTGDYRGGTAPGAWVGSVAILEEYMYTRKGVKYGQCWVFSGLLVTLCRTLGLPARSVTNFESAHDKDTSMTIDEHVNPEGVPMPFLDDSVWNFHVWNEGWFRRPDLPKGNDGWQAFDATPQEASDGKMQCGPAPVAAVKAGNVFLPYDTSFILAEVNGDRIRWMVEVSGEMRAISIVKSAVGNQISTKAVGSVDREDITQQYKYSEGSKEERDALERASEYSSRREKLHLVYHSECEEDMTITYEGHMEPNGDTNLTVNLGSDTDEPRTVKVNMYSSAIYYNGVPGNQLGEFKKEVKVEGRESVPVSWSLHARNWLGKLNEDADVVVYTFVKVVETGQVFSERQTYSVDKPDLVLQVATPQVRVGEEVEVNVSFINPLAIALGECTLMVEGPGIKGKRKLRLRQSVPGNGEMSETVTLTPKFAGQREVMACFNSNKLSNICGSIMLNVRE